MEKSYWMWNYGDFEAYHVTKVDSLRQEYDIVYPALWMLPGVYPSVMMQCEYTSDREGWARIRLNGRGYFKTDVSHIMRPDGLIHLPAGHHTVLLNIVKQDGLPCAYVESDLVPSGPLWYIEKDGRRQTVGYNDLYTTPDSNPEVFAFSYQHLLPVSREEVNGGILFDFGDEWFGPVTIDHVRPEDHLYVGYGESRTEALDVKRAYIYEEVNGQDHYRLIKRAFRYLFITGSSTVNAEADYEYLPLEYKGSFHCDDEDVNRIWQMCARTFHLNSREVFFDGIKRDRWLWSGDAYQDYKINNYLFFDRDLMKRSILAMNGPRPLIQNINTILDYSMYWIISLYDYYLTFGDASFPETLFRDAMDMMTFIAERENPLGFLDSVRNDWIFIDWSEMDKTGCVCAEQMLYIEANRSMARLCRLLHREGAESFDRKAEDLIEKVNQYYWNDAQNAFIDSYESGKNHVTRHANIFAILYNIATPDQVKRITEHVLHNEKITRITTPYFEGFELDAMGKIGDTDYIESMLHSYWKGMLDLGATTVWEEFNPELSFPEHYAMYDLPYAKSLCHAWGATPVYLLGRYYLGVVPTAPGYRTFEVRPFLGHFGQVDGTVPLPDGLVRIHHTPTQLRVFSDCDGGTVLWDGKSYPLEKDTELVLQKA